MCIPRIDNVSSVETERIFGSGSGKLPRPVLGVRCKQGKIWKKSVGSVKIWPNHGEAEKPRICYNTTSGDIIVEGMAFRTPRQKETGALGKLQRSGSGRPPGGEGGAGGRGGGSGVGVCGGVEDPSSE